MHQVLYAHKNNFSRSPHEGFYANMCSTESRNSSTLANVFRPWDGRIHAVNLSKFTYSAQKVEMAELTEQTDELDINGNDLDCTSKENSSMDSLSRASPASSPKSSSTDSMSSTYMPMNTHANISLLQYQEAQKQLHFASQTNRISLDPRNAWPALGLDYSHPDQLFNEAQLALLPQLQHQEPPQSLYKMPAIAPTANDLYLAAANGINLPAFLPTTPQYAPHAQDSFSMRFMRVMYEDAQKKVAKSTRQRPKNHKCPHCDVAFANNGQLKGHVRIHTGERPFTCEHENCGKTFTRNEELTRHRRIHTGLRPHGCPVCGKRFGRRDHLGKHLKTHYPQEQYVMRLYPYF